eukprot:1158423-Pelagomonas_calceolata.AAC.3
MGCWIVGGMPIVTAVAPKGCPSCVGADHYGQKSKLDHYARQHTHIHVYFISMNVAKFIVAHIVGLSRICFEAKESEINLNAR